MNLHKETYSKLKLWFTLVELIVTITIIAILSSIWFNSYIWYLSDARDSERKANMWEIKTALKLYKQKRWAYPLPWDTFNITNNWVIVAIQWLLNEDVTLSTMDNIPSDPYTDKSYFYSVSKNKQETQVAITLENWEFPIALLDWDYKSVSKNILPSIVLAISSNVSIEIHDLVWDWSTNRNKFILNWGNNIPYNTNRPYIPIYAWEDIDDILTSWNIQFWQNSDYRTCDELSEAAKLIHTTWTEEYQILDNTGYLSNTWCVLP